MQHGLSIDMLFNQIRTVSLDQNQLFFRLRRDNEHAVLKSKAICVASFTPRRM